LNQAIAASHERPIVFFKHSTTCGISAEAYEQMVDAVDPETSAWYLIEVRTDRPVSSAIARRFGVRHESPQVLVVGGERVRWHASHHRVTASGVRAAIEQAIV
jgi:bacillithiol system protein YtxJ